MNIFIPQSIQTMIELEEIADAQRQVISPASSKPIIGLVQDGLLGAYNMTQSNMEIDWKDFMNIIAYTSIEDFDDIKKGKVYKGTELFSKIIPDRINTSGRNISVINGKLDNNKGVMGKAMLGASKNSLIHLIWDEYDIERTRKFIDDAQRLVNNFNLTNGFSCGIGDIKVSPELEEHMSRLFSTKKLEVDRLITELENNPELMDENLFEMSVYGELNNIRETVSQLLVDNLEPENRFGIMLNSGSKGNKNNIGQMGGCVGQQAVEGNRIQKKINGRTLVYYPQNDDSAEARGFVGSSYIKGLTLEEFCFHNMSSREGLIDTAIKSVTGDTPIVIMENGITKYVNIGDWIDKLLEDNSAKVEHYTEREMELLKVNNEISIPTTDEKGNVTWGKITAITRHDPGKELYQIKTCGGRSVIVTESKSLLIWNEKKEIFERMDTPLVEVGDYVPVTMNLIKPDKIINKVNMQHYFSKNEYVYGTDYNMAIKMIDNVLKSRKKLPAGWYENNNGKLFHLPHDKSHKIRRANARNNDYVKDGFIYPYGASRKVGIKDNFELNYNNGIFLGLFLADGNVDIKSGYVQITNSNKNIKKFVKKWFTDNNINHKENVKTNKIGGITNDIRGYSTLLAKFLTKLVGSGAKNKFVPNEALSAPESFVKGLINGYVSGDGTITHNSIQITSASYRLIEGMNMLLSMHNIFGKTSKTSLKENNFGTTDIATINILSIRSKWANKFRDTIELIDNNKNDKLKRLIGTSKHINFRDYNDVVLDEIVEIKLIDVKEYPKVYDLTIPSTLNFGLANGLHVVDTAESGYIQRKLIKSMEDIIIKYDGTTRNANDDIMQFTYGDSGIDTTKQYSHTLRSITKTNDELEKSYKLDEKQLTNKYNDKVNDKFFKDFVNMRNNARKALSEAVIDYKIITDTCMLPVNFNRLINNIKSFKGDNNKLTPEYILDTINEVCLYKNTMLASMSKKDAENVNSVKYKDEQVSKFLFKFALYEYLAPKRCIYEYGLNKGQFDYIISQVIDGYNNSVVVAGEMVGCVAAQSIGEPTTQLTLNTFHSAGIGGKGTATLGVPRVKEILSLSKNMKTPQMEIYLDKKYMKDETMANKIGSYVKYTILEDVRDKIDVYYDPEPFKKDGFMDKDNVKNIFHSLNPSKHSCQSDISTLPWLIRIVLNKEKLLNKELTLLDIKTKFCTFWDSRHSNLKSLKKEDRELLDKVTHCAILSNNMNSKEPIIHMRVDMQNFTFKTIVDFVDSILDNFKLKGIDNVPGIDGIGSERSIQYGEDGEIQKDTEMVIYTKGVNLIDIRYINGIDLARTLCNDIVAVYETFGIEAARTVLLKELNKVLSGDVNHQHFCILVDIMTHNGGLLSIDRHGLNKTDANPLSRASFEKTVDQFLAAATFGEVDNMSSTSARIMAGLVIKGGTGLCNIKLDTELLMNSEFVEDLEQKYKPTYNKLSEDAIIKDVVDDDNEGEVFMPM